MPERRNANLFEVLIGQVTQNGEINIIVSKALNMLLHSELFEPVRNLLHRGYLPIAGLLIEASRHNLKARRLSLCNSGDTAGSRDQVVGYGAWMFG